MYIIDEPIKDPKHDSLERTDFYEKLSESIHQYLYEESSSLVIGLNGKWGFGKTSIINLVQKKIKSIDSEIKVINFNPWLYSPQDNIIRIFFMELINELNMDDESIKTLKKYFKIVTSQNIMISVGVPGVGSVSWNDVFKSFKENKNLESMKNELDEVFKKNKVLCIMDDIDRLDDEEIAKIFKLVKEVTNFSNVIYLMAFDREIVKNSLNKVQHNNGEKYLNKIVNVPFEVPMITREELKEEFIRQFEKSFGKRFMKKFKERFQAYKDNSLNFRDEFEKIFETEPDDEKNKDFFVESCIDANIDEINKEIPKTEFIPFLIDEFEKAFIDKLNSFYDQSSFENICEEFKDEEPDYDIDQISYILNPYKEFGGSEKDEEKGIIQFFDNIRDIKRYFNILNFNLRVVKDKIDLKDFLIIMAIQLFNPDVYHKIKKNRRLFTKAYRKKDIENDQDFKDFEKVEKIVDGDINIKFLLRELFRKIDVMYRIDELDKSRKDDTSREWRYNRYNQKFNNNLEDFEKNCNISSPKHFKTYFKLGFDKEEI